MKMKSFAILAMATCLGAAYVSTALPALAEDTDSFDSMQMLAENNSQNSSTNNPGTDETNTNGNTNNQTSNDDQGSPDTATGDDDY